MDPIDWMDVFPEHREQIEQEPQTDEQMLLAMKMWAAATSHLKQPS